MLNRSYWPLPNPAIGNRRCSSCFGMSSSLPGTRECGTEESFIVSAGKTWIGTIGSSSCQTISNTIDGRRMIPMSDRAYEVLRARAAGKAEGWLFPSARSRSGHLMDLGKQFRMARRKAHLSEDLVLYGARHDYGTRVLSNTGNLAAVMRTMGHKDVRAAMQYQHPDLELSELP